MSTHNTVTFPCCCNVPIFQDMYYVWVSRKRFPCKRGQTSSSFSANTLICWEIPLEWIQCSSRNKVLLLRRTQRGETNVIRFLSHLVQLHIHDTAQEEEEGGRRRRQFSMSDRQTQSVTWNYRREVLFLDPACAGGIHVKQEVYNLRMVEKGSVVKLQMASCWLMKTLWKS